ncbi:MAG: helix-turn-helix transcriptional regulator [Candidatus Limnocylindrales bacterium]
MRRKPGTLVPLEREVLEASSSLRSMGVQEAHGFLLARTMTDGGSEGGAARRLTAYGTLYKALDRLEVAGHLVSRWEDPEYAADAARPRRRFYRLTPQGERALAVARAGDLQVASRPVTHEGQVT